MHFSLMKEIKFNIHMFYMYLEREREKSKEGMYLIYTDIVHDLSGDAPSECAHGAALWRTIGYSMLFWLQLLDLFGQGGASAAKSAGLATNIMAFGKWV